MRLAKLSEFRSLYFTPESAPSMATLRRNFERYPGHTMVCGKRYIDLDAFDRATGAHAKIRERERELAANLLLAGLM